MAPKENMKKTRKSMAAEFVEILQNIDIPCSRLRAHPNFDQTNNIVVGYTTIEKGVNKAVYHCRHCNTTWKENSDYAYTTRQCPNCGTDTVYSNRYSSRRYNQLYVEETSNGFLAIDYYANVNFPDVNGPWYTATPEMRLGLNRVFLFDRDVGIMMGNPHTQEVAANTSKTKRYIESLMYTPSDNRGIPNERWGQLRDEVRASMKAKEAVLQAKAATKKTPSDVRANYQAKPLDKEKLFNINQMFIATVYDKTSTGTIYRVWCTACGKYHDVVQPDTIQACPYCGMIARKNNYDNRSIICYNNATCAHVLMENTTLPENDLLLRLVHVYCSVDKNPDTHELTLTKKVIEMQRIFAGKKMYVYGNGHSGDITTRHTTHKVEGHFSSQTKYAIQSDEELAEIIANSCFAKSGLAESWGLVKGYKELYPFPSIQYIVSWYKEPRLEMLAKANIPSVARHYCYHPDLLSEGNTLYEIMSISKPVLKVAQKYDLSHGDMRQFNRLYEAEESMTYEKYRTIVGYELDISRMMYLKTTFALSFDKILNYLNSVYDHQCIVRKAALTEWYDYLNMAKKLSMDLTQKSLMFPASLKKEHDIAVFAYNALKQEVDAKKFAETAARNQEKYEYSRGEFMVVIPQTPEDIIEEATKQHNCLRSYIERVRDGGTTVAFIRRKDNPYESYISVEIFEGRLMQVKAAYNRDPHDAKLDEFIHYWCKARNINPNAY